MFNIIIYSLAIGLTGVSYFKNKKKTKMALKKAWKSFENILPQFLAIILLIGISLSILTPDMISGLIGEKSGWLGMLIGAIIGSITLIPAFVAFPLAAALASNGAGVAQIVVFVSTLMMVGVVTMPLEIKHFGKKVAFLRNGLALLFSFLIAIVMGGLLK